MAAITKSWVSIADSAIDPDSPITTGLMTALRDNDIYLREWLGAGYTAGAVQDHNHDGLNSAKVEIGPNLLRNGSFESSGDGWTFTDYSGGSHAISSSGNSHGAACLAITSTVLANGGAYAVSNEYMPVAAGETLVVMAIVSASVANVSGAIEVLFYNAALSLVSTSSAYSSTALPTTASLKRAAVVVPAGAYFARVRLTGGLPGTGSAVGTVRFDGVRLTDWSVDQVGLLSGAVGQAQLKSATGTVSTTSTTAVQLLLPGGAYGFYPEIARATASGVNAAAWTGDTIGDDDVFKAMVSLRTLSSGGTAYARQRYIQSSPPYDLGDGEVPLFVFVGLGAGGDVVSTYVAPDPPWANNGPTDISVQRVIDGVGCRRVRGRWVPVTTGFKNSDMPRLPHPWGGAQPGGMTPVLIDPVGDIAHELAALHAEGENLSRLLHEGYLRLDHDPLGRAAPPGVAAIGARWKESRR